MKLFGREILAKKHQVEDELYDFAQHGLLKDYNYVGTADINLSAISGDDEICHKYLDDLAKKNKIAKDGKTKTPKEVYILESLNDDTFKMNCDPAYIERQVRSLKRKANLLPKEEPKKMPWGITIYSGAAVNGRREVESLAERMQNRLRYKEFEEFYGQFAYTTSAKINELLKEVTNLRAQRLEEFIPDLPDEALDVIEQYNEKTLQLCGKRPVYYMIADKEDFGEHDEKRDPILLVQSPFNLGWQAIAAYDDEMVYLGDL